MDGMMRGPELLRDIVVKISPDRKRIKGTGFLISEDEIVTCYHVLDDKSNGLSERYYVKNDKWTDWLEVKLSKEKCRPPSQDMAFLRCPFPLKLADGEIRFLPWNGKTCEFQSRGYDCNTTSDEGASTISGTDCEIVDYTSRGGETRMQLRTIKRTLLPGRSGSPVWSMNQNAIVGMIDYQAGDENIWTDRSMAIPIEVMIPEARLSAGKNSGRLFKVPELPPNFLLRLDDLAVVKEGLLIDAGRSTAITGALSKVGLHGMGGIGKSVLAAAVARDEDVQRGFYDGIFWLTLGTDPKMIMRRQSDLAEMLDKPHAFEDIEQGWTYLSKLLTNRTCLIVLDDVWHAEDVKGFFSDLGSQCRILITTRDAGIITALGAQEYRLGLLSSDEALELLARWAERDITDLPPEASQIGSECGRLPLALALCGAQVNDGIPWKDLLEALQEAALEFLDHPHGSVMKSMKVSVDHLSAEQAECYRKLAVFPPDESVPEATILTFWTFANKLKEREARRIVSMLERKALLKKSGKAEGSIIELHDLQHDYLRVICQDVRSLQGVLLDAYSQKVSQGKWHTGPNDGYFFQHLAYHLLQAGKEGELKALLLDFDWMKARLQATDAASLIRDYDFLPPLQDILAIQGAIRLSAHVIFRNSSELQGQLFGRLMEQGLPQIRNLLEQIPRLVQDPWLRPLIQSLTPPGGHLIQTLRGHFARVNTVTVSSNGKIAISGSNDSSIRVWDLESGREVRILRGHNDPVSAVALASDCKKVISGSWDNTLKVWDLKSGQQIQTLRGHTRRVNAIAVSCDGEKAISGSWDNTLKVWDLKSGQEIQTLRGHNNPVNAVALTSDGMKAISGSWDNTLKVWDLKSGQEIQTLRGHNNPVNAVALTSDGMKAISGSSDNTLKVWDLKSGQEIQTLRGHTRRVNAVAMSSDGRKAISGSHDETLKIWDLENGQEVQTLRGHTRQVNAVAVSSDGKKAVSTSGDATLKVWNLESGQEVHILRSHAVRVHAVAVSADGKKAMSASRDGTIKIWDIESGQEIQTIRGHTGRIKAIIMTSDEKIVVSRSGDGTIRLWNLESDQEILAIRSHTGPLSAIALTSDGKKAISTSNDKTLKIWDIESGREVQNLIGHNRLVRVLTFTPDGKKAISGSNDRTLKIWDIESGQEIQTLRGHSGLINAVAVTSDGKKAISGSGDRTLKIWDIESGQEIQTLRGHNGPVRAVALTPDGKKAISGSGDSTLKVWDPANGRIIAEFTGDGAITSVALSSDGRTVIAGEALGRVHFLRLENMPI
jgi:WD40 repeat protein